jgi:hypothetical protein
LTLELAGMLTVGGATATEVGLGVALLVWRTATGARGTGEVDAAGEGAGVPAVVAAAATVPGVALGAGVGAALPL